MFPLSFFAPPSSLSSLSLSLSMASIPLLSKSSSSASSESEISTAITITTTPCGPHKPVAVIHGHAGPVSSLALAGEFLLSASHEIVVYQHPHLQELTKFHHNSTNNSIKSLITVGNRVFTAHQDSKIRVWKLSRSNENPFKLIATLPTKKDIMGKFLKQGNYVQTRRNHQKLWIEHADSISCLAVCNGLIYSGSWDKTLKVWRMSDLRCLESIKAHDDAINGLAAHKGLVFSASGDGKIKIWEKRLDFDRDSHCLKGCLEGDKGVCWNALVVCEEGRLVYGGGSDGRIMGWERDNDDDGKGENWRLVCDVRAHEKAVLSLCSMGEFMCSGSADKSIGVWRRGEGRLIRVRVLRGHEGAVKCLQASEIGVGDGFMLYSGGLDKSLRVWWVQKKYRENEEEEKKCILLR